jgi:hypothetical protein
MSSSERVHMTSLGIWLNMRQIKRANIDALMLGQSILKETRRGRFNPLRYIAGEHKLKRIDPLKTLTHEKILKAKIILDEAEESYEGGH